MSPRRRDLRASASPKTSNPDVVTAADLEAERIVLEVLLGARPDDGVLAEESSSRQGTSKVTWIVDPLDGTTNFIYGYPGFAVSIAASLEGAVVAGVVNDPIAGETFAATLGGGATLNGEAIAPNAAASLGSALVGTGFGFPRASARPRPASSPSCFPPCATSDAAAAPSSIAATVGAGRLDAYFEAGLKPWDCAAGLLAAEEAGCASRLLSQFPDQERTLVIASGAILDALVARLLDSDAQAHPAAPRSKKVAGRTTRSRVYRSETAVVSDDAANGGVRRERSA